MDQKFYVVTIRDEDGHRTAVGKPYGSLSAAKSMKSRTLSGFGSSTLRHTDTIEIHEVILNEFTVVR